MREKVMGGVQYAGAKIWMGALLVPRAKLGTRC